MGLRVLFSFAALFKWPLTKIYVKGAFLQSGPAARDVYVVPPRECRDRNFIGLVTVATYGLVNTNAKWQSHSDSTFIKLGLHGIVHIPQLFYSLETPAQELLAVKITNDIFIAGNDPTKRNFIERLSEIYELSTITHLPGTCLLFGLHVSQSEDCSICVHADSKPAGISPYQVSRARRKQASDSLNTFEQFHFNTINGSIGFIGVHADPIAAFVSSHLQQRLNDATVHDIVIQSSLL